jgi:arginase family enzyme
MQNHFINIPFNKSSAKGTIYNKFDYEISDILYSSMDNDEVPVVYNLTYKYIKSLKLNLRPIVFSPDYSISSATCIAMAEKFLEKGGNNGIVKYSSTMKIVYFTSTSHTKELTHISALDFSKSIITNILDQNKISYTKHQFIISPENIYMLGLNDNLITQDDKEKLNLEKIKFFTLSQVNKKGYENICQYLIDEICDSPVYIIYDMSVLSFDTSPCTFRLVDNINKNDKNKMDGFSYDIMLKIFESLKVLDIVGIDITGYNLKNDTPDVLFKITSQAAKIPLVSLLGLKEKKINIFNENTKIVICKPYNPKQINWENNVFSNKQEIDYAINNIKNVLNNNDNDNDNDECDIGFDSDKEEDEREQVQELEDIGWYVMRGIPIELRENLIRKIMESKDNIISYVLDDGHMYISYTTIEEQEKKSYYTATSIKDRALTPGEKLNLMFSQI